MPFALVSAKNTLSFTNKQGIAIRGYDTVAYFTKNIAVKGTPDFQHSWNQAVWYFSKQEHLVLFKESPQKYAPQYGGYCSWAVANNSLAPINPKAFAIIDKKLYLNYNFLFHKKWLKKRKKLIFDADENWPFLIEKIKKNGQKL